MNPNDSDWAVRFTNFGFHWYLGANPSTAAVNLSQTWILGVPVIGAANAPNARTNTTTTIGKTVVGAADMAVGMTRATKALGKATFQVPFAEQRGTLSPDEQAAFKEFAAINLFEKTQAADLTGLAEKGEEYLSPARKLSEWSAWMFHKAEVINREVTALAAYRLAKERGLSHEAAILEAEDLTWDTHFDYSNKNRPRIMQQGTGRVVFLFKNYSANIGYRMARDFTDGVKGKDRHAALTRLTGVLGTTALAAGARGLPIWWAIYGVAMMLEDDDEPIHVEGAIRSQLTELVGEDGSALIMDGAIDNLTGLSVSQRMSLSNLFIRNTEKAMDGNELVAHYAQEAAGPLLGAFLVNLGMAGYDYSRGNDELAKEKITPTIVKAWLQSNRMEAEGLRNRSGQQIISKEEFTEYDKWVRRTGFSLDKVAKAYKRNEVAYVLDDKLEKRKSRLRARWVRATERGQGDMVKSIEAQIEISNEKQGHFKDKISRASLYKTLRARKTNNLRSINGVSRRAADRAQESGMQNF